MSEIAAVKEELSTLRKELHVAQERRRRGELDEHLQRVDQLTRFCRRASASQPSTNEEQQLCDVAQRTLKVLYTLGDALERLRRTFGVA